MNTEKVRKSCRFDLDCPATIVLGEFTLLGKILNIGRGGATICTPLEIQPKEQFNMAWEIPASKEVVSVKGTALRTTPVRSKNGFPAFASNVQFTEIPHETLKYLAGNTPSEWHQDGKKPPRQSPQRFSFPLEPHVIFLGALCLVAVACAYQLLFSEADKNHWKIKEQVLVLPTGEKPQEKPEKPFGQDRKEETSILHARLTEFQTELNPPKENPKDFAAHLPAASKVRIGDRQPLVVEKTAPAHYHVVQAGENLYRIGLAHKISTEEILRLNSLPPGSSIQPGQKLLLSKPGTLDLSAVSAVTAD